jgi:hypothetical protein
MKAEWKYLEGLFLSDIISREDATQLGAKGALTVADLIRSAVQQIKVDRMSIGEFDLPTHAVRRLLAKGYTTIGSTDELSEEMVRIYIPGLGEKTIDALNVARESVSKPPLRKH